MGVVLFVLLVVVLLLLDADVTPAVVLILGVALAAVIFSGCVFASQPAFSQAEEGR